MIKSQKQCGFTLAELLIALGVIAILSAILMPIMHHFLPNQNILMAKRAFYTTETIVSELINDQNCYPKRRTKTGFDDGLRYTRCEKWNLKNAKETDVSKKFLTLFADKLDVKEQSADLKTIKTKDGMVWKFSDINFNKNRDSYAILTIDVNGENRSPNCGQVTLSGICTPERKKGFDKFTMKIFTTGKVQIQDCWAILAAQTGKKIIGDEEVPADCSNQ